MSSDNNLVKLFVSSLSEIFAAGLATVMIDYKYFGRKNSMILFFLLSSLACALTFFS